MENSGHLNLISCDFIKYREWKAANHSTPQVSIDDWKRKWMINDARQDCIKALHKLIVEISALVRVPVAGLSEFGLRLGCEANHHGC